VPLENLEISKYLNGARTKPKLSRNAFAEMRTQSASLETSFPGIALNEAERTIIPEHSFKNGN